MRPIVLKTLKNTVYQGFRQRDQNGPAYFALCQLIGMIQEANRKVEKYKRLRQTHLNLIKKQCSKIETLEKEIEYLKEQRKPTPQCYTIDKPNYDPDGFDENDFAHAVQTGGFQIPRF